MSLTKNSSGSSIMTTVSMLSSVQTTESHNRIRTFWKFRSWSGVLVEPAPHNFLNCISNRSSRNSIYCNACVSFEYKEKYVDIEYANLMSVSKNLKLDIDNWQSHIDKGKRFLRTDEPVFSFGSMASPLNTLLDQSGAPTLIDFISLDVEGAELEVLKGIDYDKYVFKFMLIEVRDLQTICSYLSSVGYHLKQQMTEHDYLFTSIKPWHVALNIKRYKVY